MRVAWLMMSFAAIALAEGAGGATPVDGARPEAMSFRLEGKPAIDDVFGDSSEYRRTIDRFLALTANMQTTRDEFAQLVQIVLRETAGAQVKGGRRACPTSHVATPYAKAQRLGEEYLRVGRELARHHEQVREYDRLGESLGLTPDYRWKVKKVLQQYQTLLVDYREMKVAFHDQLNDELRYAGCDLASLIEKGDPGASVALDWPQPGQPGAPGVAPAGAKSAKELGPPPNLKLEKVPPPQPIALPRRPPGAEPGERRSGVLFFVDNTRCQRSTRVFLDGKRIGEVAAATRVGFQAVPGPHDLCLLDGFQKSCGEPGTVRRAHLHEGWTISLRCE